MEKNERLPACVVEPCIAVLLFPACITSRVRFIKSPESPDDMDVARGGGLEWSDVSARAFISGSARREKH